MKVECCICLENFDGICKILTPTCGHLFHGNCINVWLEKNETCPQCRLAVNRNQLHFVHLTATVTSRRESIFDSSLCQDYRQLNENLLEQQENNAKEIEDLKKKVEQLVRENMELKREHNVDRIQKLMIENEKLKKEISGCVKIGTVQNERPGPILLRQQSVDSYKNVKSVVAKAWKK